MTVRISAKDLPPELLEKLEAGESVEIERDGEVIARVERDRSRETDWEAWAREADEAEPVDYDELLGDVEHIRSLTNRPVERPSWA